MYKTEFVEKMVEKVGGSKADAKRYYDAFMDIVTDKVTSGEPITFTGFGKFSLTKRKPRTMYNPRTREPIAVGERNVIRFQPSVAIKRTINEA